MKLIPLSVFVVGVVAFGQTEQLPSDQIAAAVVEGTQSKKSRQGVFVGADEGGNYWAMLRGPYGRIVALAAEAASKYQPITAAQVPSEASENRLEVIVTPGKPSYSRYGGWKLTPPAKHVVIRAKGTNTAIQPTRIEPFTTSWSNAMGGKFEGTGVVAMFDAAALPPAGDLEIVLVGERFEQVRTVKAKDRPKMR